MGIGYQRTDRAVIDYELWFVDEGRIALRGPPVDLTARPLVCFIGAAQTFGRFVPRPFPQVVGDVLGVTAANLGISGAGPALFLERPFLRDLIERADMVVVQCMSARSVSAGRFRTGVNFGVLHFADGDPATRPMMAAEAYRVLRRREGLEAYRAQVSAVQEKWVELYHALADAIVGKSVLLWISSCAPGSNLPHEASIMGEFPHFVSAEMMAAVRPRFDAYAEAIVAPMEPQLLVNERTRHLEEVFNRDDFPDRQETTRCLNTYYATPPVHAEATRALVRALLPLMDGHAAGRTAG